MHSYRTVAATWGSAAVMLAVAAGWSGVCMAQPASPVFVDDSPRAADGLVRARELASVGNLDESVRVLQSLLDEEGERLLSAAGDPDLFTTVRVRVHAALLADAALLERYRALMSPVAKPLLDGGRVDLVERSYFLTSPGFEGALRQAQLRLEAAQFHGARQVLETLENHPDRKGDLSRDAARLLRLTASYLDDGEARPLLERAARWDGEAGGEPVVAEMPTMERVQSLFTAVESTDLAELLPRPLWSDPLGDPLPLESTVPARNIAEGPKEGAMWLFAAPIAVGDLVYVNDTHAVTAWNRFTLSKQWRVKIDGVQGRRFAVGPQQGFEEMSSVAADGSHVVAMMGLALQGTDTPRRSMISIDARSGAVLWSRVLEDFRLDELRESNFRGPVVLDQGVAIALVEKDVTRRRLESTYAIGLDAHTGALRWTRQMGSSGSLAYGIRPSILDVPGLSRGVVYFVNRIGFAAAVETASGRTKWIRRIPGTAMTVNHADQPWESNTPVFIGDRMFVVSPDQQNILMLDVETGALLGRCPATKFNGADYLLRVGERLVGVSSTSLVAGESSEFGPEMATRRIAQFAAGQLRGRAVVFGDRVMLPMVDGARIYKTEPGSTEESATKLELDKPGNILPLDGQLLVVDDREVHTYLVWEAAERMLQARMEAEPKNPEPAVTFAELSYRAGRPEHIVMAVDQALARIERDPLSTVSEDNQRRLFRALFSMIEPGSDVPVKMMLPLPMRGELLQRLERTASDASERVAYLLASGRYAESMDLPGEAVEAYQQVLDMPELASSTFLLDQTLVPAEFEATRRLRRVVQTHGIAIYEAFQVDAERQLAALAETLDPEPFEALARRYPVSRASARAWLESGERYARQGRSKLSAQALEEGLAAARGSLAMTDPMIGELTGRLVQQFLRTGLLYPALTALDVFEKDHAGLMLTARGETLDRESLRSSIRARLDERTRRPAIGSEPAGSSTIIGWSILPPIDGSDHWSTVTDRLMMITMENDIALFRAQGEGPPVKVWDGQRDDEYLWMDQAGVYFCRLVGEGSQRDVTVLKRDINTGEVLWETAAFRSNFDPGALEALLADPSKDLVPVIDTPLVSRIPVTEVTFVKDQQTLALIERLGRVVTFDLETGKRLWRSGATVSRVHDAALEAGTLLIGGAEGPVDLSKPFADAHSDDVMPGVVLSMDARTGQVVHRYETAGRVRWVKLAPEGFSIVGLEDSIVSLDAYRGRVRWSATAGPVRGSAGAWVYPGRVIVRCEDDELRQLRTDDGSLRLEALERRGRQPGALTLLRLLETGDTISAVMRRGLLVYGPDGGLVGADATEDQPPLIYGGYGDAHAVTFHPRPEDAEEDQGTVSSYLLNVFSMPSLKLVSRTSVQIGSVVEPGPVQMLDGKLLISSGTITTVIELPVK